MNSIGPLIINAVAAGLLLPLALDSNKVAQFFLGANVTCIVLNILCIAGVIK